MRLAKIESSGWSKPCKKEEITLVQRTVDLKSEKTQVKMVLQLIFSLYPLSSDGLDVGFERKVEESK